jgi:putative tryptophan/tyrosine transport system substrate-binding protein
MRRREFLTVVGGAALTRPRWGRVRQPAHAVVGLLHPLTKAAGAPAVAELLAGLATKGYVEGREVTLEYRYAEGREGTLPALAADLVARRVAVIATLGGDGPALAAKAATVTIPVVSAFATDPVHNGFVAALTHPEGNFTGVYRFGTELEPKRVEIFCEVLPRVGTIDVLANPDGDRGAFAMQNIEAAARRLDRRTRLHPARNAAEIDAALAAMARLGARALLVTGDPNLAAASRQIGEWASGLAIPGMAPSREFAVAGGLMSYAADESDVPRLVGVYTGRVLAGERPAQMPVQQLAKIELTVNLRSARALGLTLPADLLAGAAAIE